MSENKEWGKFKHRKLCQGRWTNMAFMEKLIIFAGYVSYRDGEGMMVKYRKRLKMDILLRESEYDLGTKLLHHQPLPGGEASMINRYYEIRWRH